MRRPTTLRLVVLGCLMLTATLGFSQAPAPASSFGSLQESLKLRSGERIEITDISGKKISAKLSNIAGSVLTARDGKATLQFKEADIAEIRHRKPERWWDGMLIGLGVGAATGFAAARGMCGNDSECSFYTSVVLVPTFTGGGAGIGALIDSLHHKDETVYSRNAGAAYRRLSVAPVLGKNSAGIRMSFSF